MGKQSCSCPNKYVEAKCVKTKCLKACKGEIKNLKTENLTVYKTLDLCKAKVIQPGECQPFHGWWRTLTKSNIGTSYSTQLVFIDMVSEEKRIYYYAGNVKYVHEFPEDEVPFSTLEVINDRVISINVDTSSTQIVDGITGTFPDNNNQYLTLQVGGEYDGLLSWEILPFSAKNEQFEGSNQLALMKKLKFDPTIEIRPYGNGDNNFVDSNSRKFMFEQVTNNFFLNNYISTSPAGQDERLLERPERLALKDAILTTGVERDVVDIFNINKSIKNSGITTVMVKGSYHFVNEASQVRFSGLTGDWSDLNDTYYKVCGIYNTEPETVEEQAPFYQTSTRIYYLQVVLDTSGKETFDKSVHGNNSVIKPSKVGPVTEDINHTDFIDACIYFIIKSLQQSTHSRILHYTEMVEEGDDFLREIDSRMTKPSLQNWEDVSKAILNEIPSFFQQHTFKSFFGNTICPPYYLPFWQQFYNCQVNEPFTALGVPGSEFFPPGVFIPEYATGNIGNEQVNLPAFGYNTPIENYILPESRRWLYFRVKPDTPVTNEQQENVWVLANYVGDIAAYETRGYASVGPGGLNTQGQLGGSRLEGLMSATPWGDETDVQLNDGFWSPFTDFDQFDPQTFNAGIINPDLVGGKKIGYLTFIANILHDPSYISLNINFGNPDLASNPDANAKKRQQYDGEREVIAEMMKYFISENVDAMIIDNRINGGGYNTHSFLECFGDDRKGITNLTSFQNQDNRNAIDVDFDIDVFSGTKLDNRTIRKVGETSPWDTIKPSLMENDYPGSVFKNGCCIMLTSQFAGSGGDQITRFFMGDTLDGNIGNDVQCYVVGSIDGILNGYSFFNKDLITSKFGSEFPDTNGIGSTPVQTRGETFIYNNIGGVTTDTRLANGQPITGLVPVNSNIVGPVTNSNGLGGLSIVQGALSTNIQDTVYFDFGFTGPGESVSGDPSTFQWSNGHWDNPPIGIDQVGSFPGQPDPLNLSTLRDSWLEESIRVIRLCLGDTLTLNRNLKSKDVTLRNFEPSKIKEISSKNVTCLKDVECYMKKKEKIRNKN